MPNIIGANLFKASQNDFFILLLYDKKSPFKDLNIYIFSFVFPNKPHSGEIFLCVCRYRMHRKQKLAARKTITFIEFHVVKSYMIYFETFKNCHWVIPFIEGISFIFLFQDTNELSHFQWTWFYGGVSSLCVASLVPPGLSHSKSFFIML